jgi:hypothetical protein
MAIRMVDLSTIVVTALSLSLTISEATAQGSVEGPPCNLHPATKEIAPSRPDYLKGMVALTRGLRCSGALVTFKGRVGSAAGLVLTNGHCSGRGTVRIKLKSGADAAMLAPGEVLRSETYLQHLTLATGNSTEPNVCVQAQEIVYGTMTDGDVMLIKLIETYDQIAARTGVNPFVISGDPSFPVGLLVRVPSLLFPHDRECEVDATVVQIKEVGWRWGPVLRLSRGCEFEHGVSGAPIIRRDTNEIIAVFSTVNDGDARPCDLNNPCEIESESALPAAKKGRGYGHLLHKIYTCLNPAHNFDLDEPGCQLNKPGR